MGGDHKCPVCQATFTRPQHVARHMRSHTGDRPYKCQHCGDQFARSDLLSRHVNKCHAAEKSLLQGGGGAGGGAGGGMGGRRKGTTAATRATTSKQACDQCVQSSLPCDGSNPCGTYAFRVYFFWGIFFDASRGVRGQRRRATLFHVVGRTRTPRRRLLFKSASPSAHFSFFPLIPFHFGDLAHAAPHLGTAQTLTTLLWSLPSPCRAAAAAAIPRHGVKQEEVFRQGAWSSECADVVGLGVIRVWIRL
ncbi:hypothetical protein C8F04DRAFT_1296951 [Mycena alexandri]|uniref:C2H2-type domain-containing protein n=1 Tax=Mycena alexandri TaxID=1745969 RepID=A0AAD6SHR8_9AGAR|nr:hypothetical protein C8F04DRAFT_1296951 [Mycena alexandri]